MKFKTRDIVIGIVVIAIVVTAGVLYKNLKSPKSLPLPTTSPETESLLDDFNYQVPEDVERADLVDVSGGDGMGIATRKYKNGTFTHTVLADLPDLIGGYFYEGWLVRGEVGDSDFTFISTGKMRVAKGGYLLEFNSKIDYSDYTGVVITKELTDDKSPEGHVLEGSF